MRTRENIKDYIGSLLGKREFDKDIDQGISMSLLLLKVYIHGLEKKNFPLDFTAEPKDVPEPCHVSAGKMAALLENEAIAEQREYLQKTLENELSKLTTSFIREGSNPSKTNE